MASMLFEPHGTGYAKEGGVSRFERQTTEPDSHFKMYENAN
jgi:hypothetical protein